MTERDNADGSRGVSTTGTTRRTFLRTTGAGVVAAATTGALSGSAAADPPDEFVGTDGTEFVLDGEPIHFNGSNNFWLMDEYFGTPELHDAVFSLYDRLGLNFVRTWGFRDGTSDAGPMLQPEPGEYNEEAFRRFDSLVAKAGEYGIRLVLPLVNNWEEYGGKHQYVDWVDGASSADEFFTNDECRRLYRDYVEYVLTRENAITGVEYRNDPTIAIWELGNEPRAKTLDDNVGAMGEWIQEMSAHIKELAPDQLVSTGMEGFYDGSDYGSGFVYDGSQGTAYVDHHQYDTIDVCSYHMYPQAWNQGAEWGTDWISQHQTDAEEEIGKPAYLGEFDLSLGNVSASQRNQYYQDYYDALDEHDAAGALLWQITTDDAPSRTDKERTHAILESDQETIDIVRDYGARARAKSGVALEPDAPVAPSNVGMTGRTATSVDLTWDPTKGCGVGGDRYSIRLDGSEVATAPADRTAATVSDLDPATSYEASVVAVDTAGDTSEGTTASVATLPEETTTTTDPCEDLSMLADASDTGALSTDTSNTEYFVTPDGDTDGARIVRGSQGEAALVYTVDGQLLDASAQVHRNTNQGGTVEFYESADGGASWQQISAVTTVYDGSGSGGWSNERHSVVGFSEGVDRVRIVITGGDAAWAPQVGAVTLVSGDESDDPRGDGPGADAQDLDDDGVYEDVNGNGEVDYDDVVELFNNMDEFEQPAMFDFNGNGEIDYADVVELSQMV